MVSWFLKLVSPFVKWIGKLHWPFTDRKLTGRDYYLVRDDVYPGATLLLSKKWEPSNLINRAKYKHASLYLGGDKVKYCYEAVGSGVRPLSLVDSIMKSDGLVICAPKFLKTGDIEKLRGIAKSKVGLPYDYWFNLGNKQLYCFEFNAVCYKELYPDLPLKTKVIAGLKIYDWETFVDSELFDVSIVNQAG